MKQRTYAMNNNHSERTHEQKRQSLIVHLLMRMVKEKPLGILCGIVILILIAVSIFADILAPYGPNEINLVDRLGPPSSQYLLGTDQLGRDVMSRIIYGARISLIVGLAATACEVVFAVLIGSITGYFGGKFDLIMQRVVDAWMSFPSLLLLLTIMSIVGRGLLQIILVLGISGGIRSSRVVRSAVLGVKENEYVRASEATGCSKGRILVRHILPNIMAPVIVIFTIAVGTMIVSEASLSFLGFGLPPEIPSWGGQLSREGRLYMEMAPLLALWPGLSLTIVVYSLNMFGDALRDLLDPRLRGL